METARDLACADLWQASLERSLARRGRSTRGSLELFHLRPERDLSRADLLRESAVYSQMRRSATTRRSSMVLPGAGGISALALLAVTTLPGLLGGRGGAARTARLTYRADEHASKPAKAPKTGIAIAPSNAAATAATVPGTTTAPAVARAASVPPYVAIPQTLSAPAAPSRASSTTHAHIAAARDASGGAAGVASHAASGGAAPEAQQSVSATTTAPAVHTHTTPATVHRHTTPAVHIKPIVHKVPAVHTAPVAVHTKPVVRNAPANPTAPAKAPTHLSTGGGAVEQTPATHPRPVAAAHPRPVAKPHPVATTPPAAKPAPAPAPPVAAGQYVNPLADARVTPERIDQGVDYAGSGPLRALGDGKITYVGTSGTGWPGAFIEYQLTDGSQAGRYVYYAEGINPAPGLHVGQPIQAGQPIAQIVAGDSSGIEIGWGAGIGTESYAMQHGQWHGGDDADSVPSPAGKDFSALIAELGGPPGKIEG